MTVFRSKVTDKQLFWLSACRLVVWVAIMVSLVSCDQSQQEPFEVLDFKAMINYEFTNDDTLVLSMDLSDGIERGIVIPSDSATERYFQIRFKLKNNQSAPARLLYKVYYQNESYKFEESHVRSNNNFYGSWHEGELAFRYTEPIPSDGEYHEVLDSIRIVGNPRNEDRYLSDNLSHAPLPEMEYVDLLRSIRKNPDWMKAILKKSRKREIPPSDYLFAEAEWILRNRRSNTIENTRWKRNPRTGDYRFALVVATEKSAAEIPDYVKNITLKDPATNNYQNPFSFFSDTLNYPSNVQFAIAPECLRTKIAFEPSRGIFVNTMDLPQRFDSRFQDDICNSDSVLYHDAHFQQFIHHSSYKHYFDNIPRVANVVEENYSRESYRRDSLKFVDGWKRSDSSSDTDAPCTTVGYDPKRDAIFVKNPGSSEDVAFRKENVGVKTRVGTTYGKYTAKIQFPKIVNQEYVWNGLTCAFWLYYQSASPWNYRTQVCEGGYIPKGSSDYNDRHETDPYSEIDIEIVKTSKYWPQTSYGDRRVAPVDDALNENVIITCTNWDLACPDPPDEVMGVTPFEYKGQTFDQHRWDFWYKAVTIKTEYPQSQTLGDVFYFQIDWQPDQIIWRIGPDKENMTVIGYMDDSNTIIPDNQMIAIVTQEFHHGTWWPLARFQQGLIPYPKNDLTGYIHSIEIE